MNRTIRKNRSAAKGMALIMVLGLIMAITILGLGFLSESQTEMACGENMALRMQMDQTAASALEHARGLILNPPEESLDDGYWAGATAQQLDGSSKDFYDVHVAIAADDRCDYDVSCQAYRIEDGERVGLSTLSAQLRLDPSIVLWLGATNVLPQGSTITGDVYCAGDLTTLGTIEGDVFADGAVNGATPTGRTTSSVAQPPLAWPGITVADYTPSYRMSGTGYNSTTVATATHPAGSFTPDSSNPGGVRYRGGDATLPGNVNITGLLVVDGDLTISGSDNIISAVQSLPALLVSGDVIVEANSSLTIDGLAVIEGQMLLSADAGAVSITGGLLVRKTIRETTADASGNGLTGTVYGAPTWNSGSGTLELDGVDDYVDCGNDGSLRITEKITLAAWVETNDVGNGQHNPFVTKGDKTYALKYNGHENSIEFFIYDGTWRAVWYPVDSSFNGQWHHVAGTYDGSDVKLYIDGNLQGQMHHVGTINNRNYPVNIGKNAEEADRFYDGAIDEVRIYSRALDPNEILNLYNSPYAAGDPSGLRARYQFDAAGCNVTLTADPRKTALIIWDWDSDSLAWKGQYWSQAAGAFFKRVGRDAN